MTATQRTAQQALARKRAAAAQALCAHSGKKYATFAEVEHFLAVLAAGPASIEHSILSDDDDGPDACGEEAWERRIDAACFEPEPYIGG